MGQRVGADHLGAPKPASRLPVRLPPCAKIGRLEPLPPGAQPLPVDFMRILVSNDDGYFAPGIAALAEALSTLGEVTVVAPERDRSGASNSLTLDRPLSLRRTANGFYYVNGTPDRKSTPLNSSHQKSSYAVFCLKK